MDVQVVRADEIDDTGTDISTISPTNDVNFEAKIETRQEQSGSKLLTDTSTPLRPILRRETSTPAPPKQPPPPTPSLDESVVTDSLSLAQLKRLVSDLPKFEAAAYAYTYEDTRSLPEELEEWFQYTDEDVDFLSRGKEAFEYRWQHEARDTKAWSDTSRLERASFLNSLLHDMPSQHVLELVKNLDAVVYITLGVWYENAGLEENLTADVASDDRYRRSSVQIRWIWDAVGILVEIGMIPRLYGSLRQICENEKLAFFQPLYSCCRNGETNLPPLRTPEMRSRGTAPVMDGMEKSIEQARHQELNSILTVLYIVVECGRQQVTEGKEHTIRQTIGTQKTLGSREHVDLNYR